MKPNATKDVSDLLAAAFDSATDSELAATIMHALILAQKVEQAQINAAASPEVQKRNVEFEEMESIYKEADRLCVVARINKTSAPTWAWAVVQGGIDTNPASLPRIWGHCKKKINAQEELDKIAKYFRYRQTVLTAV